MSNILEEDTEHVLLLLPDIPFIPSESLSPSVYEPSAEISNLKLRTALLVLAH